jgi:hypothetical protein
MPDPSASFVVRRVGWTSRGGPPDDFPRRLPATYPVASFPTSAEARAEARRLERKARRGVNPFTLGGPALFFQTSLDAGRLSDWLLDRGVTPPTNFEAGHGAWLAWWTSKHQRLSEAGREAVWEALDKVRFFVVDEWPATAYAAVQIAWKLGVQRGDLLPSDCEGGYVRRLFRSRPEAERAVADLDGELREQERRDLEHEEVNHAGYEVARLGLARPRKRRSVGAVPFAELIEVPMPEGETGPTAYLLQRPAFDPEGPFCTDHIGDLTEGVVPLGLYPTREQAEAARQRCEAEARRLVSPFAFPPPHYSLLHLTRLSYAQLKKATRRLGLDPAVRPKGTIVRPQLGVTEYWPELWLRWWDERVDAMTDEQREGVWALLDRLRLCSVEEVTLEG